MYRGPHGAVVTGVKTVTQGRWFKPSCTRLTLHGRLSAMDWCPSRQESGTFIRFAPGVGIAAVCALDRSSEKGRLMPIFSILLAMWSCL